MSAFFDLVQIILIDLSLAGDNALVVAMAVAGLPHDQRKRALTAAIMAATLLRILMAFFAVQLLHMTGLLAAGGILLLWVGWKMIREMHALHHSNPGPMHASTPKLSTSIWQIIIADVSMSLDNVLGVAGVARDHMVELVIGLVLSVVLMGLVSSRLAQLGVRYPKIGYLAVAVIFYTALRMIYDSLQALPQPIHAFV